MKFRHLALALTAAISISAQAADSINVGNHSGNATYAIDILGGTSSGISGLEASAVTHARAR